MVKLFGGINFSSVKKVASFSSDDENYYRQKINAEENYCWQRFYR